MKVIEETKTFTPVYIKIETYEELNEMYDIIFEYIDHYPEQSKSEIDSIKKLINDLDRLLRKYS
jgi:hypothetical protein